MTPGNTTLTSAQDTEALSHWITAPTAAAVLLLALVLATARPLRQRLRKSGIGRHRGTAAVQVAAVAAVGCNAYSADTSWRFAADYLDMGSAIERAAMFAAAELALFATALMARQNLNGPKQAPGLPGTLTWVITAVQILPAYAESGPVGGTVRAFVGPVMAAMLWHLSMGIELRHHTPHADSHSLAALLTRQLRERLLARLKIVDRNADAARIIRERALDQAVALILRTEAMTPGQRTKRRGRRLIHRLHHALEQADVDRDERQDELLLRKLATRQQALTLATITLPPRWPASTADTTGSPAHNRTRVAVARRRENPFSPHVEDAGNEAVGRAARPDPDDRPKPSDRTTTGSEPIPGKEADADPGATTPMEPKRPGRRPDASQEVLTDYACRIHHETGRLSRDLLKKAVRDDGYSVATDRAADVVRTVKAELNATRFDHPQ